MAYTPIALRRIGKLLANLTCVPVGSRNYIENIRNVPAGGLKMIKSHRTVPAGRKVLFANGYEIAVRSGYLLAYIIGHPAKMEY